MARILVVDDDAAMRSVLRRLAERDGHRVEEAADGREALKAARVNPPDLIITDIVMPEMEGIELIVTMRREHPEMKILAISGGGRIGPSCYLDLAGNVGADATLEKPFEINVLLSTIEKILATGN